MVDWAASRKRAHYQFSTDCAFGGTGSRRGAKGFRQSPYQSKVPNSLATRWFAQHANASDCLYVIGAAVTDAR